MRRISESNPFIRPSHEPALKRHNAVGSKRLEEIIANLYEGLADDLMDSEYDSYDDEELDSTTKEGEFKETLPTALPVTQRASGPEVTEEKPMELLGESGDSNTEELSDLDAE